MGSCPNKNPILAFLHFFFVTLSYTRRIHTIAEVLNERLGFCFIERKRVKNKLLVYNINKPTSLSPERTSNN